MPVGQLSQVLRHLRRALARLAEFALTPTTVMRKSGEFRGFG